MESVVRGPSPGEQQAMLAEVRAAPKTLRPVAPHLARHALPGGDAAAMALGGLLPPGWFPTTYLERFPGLAAHVGWPGGLWICALHAGDGELVVFGRDRTDVSVVEAVEASSAVPGMFRPKMIDGEQFLDGGLVSPTHADLVVPARPDLVIVSSPMSRPSRRPMAVHARRRLAEELDVLSEAGIETVLIEPPEGFARLARGFPRRNPAAFRDIVRIAGDRTRAALEASGI